jgi:hypothetical protein
MADVPKTTTPKPALDPERLYEEDNGRIVCGALACAGSSAHFTGRTTSGQRVKLVTTAFAEEWFVAIGEPIKCARCGKRHNPALR